MKALFKKYQGFITLLIILILALPFLFFYQRQMFWDITLINLPWRYHLSESINNGVLPLWNPYMNYGSPQMGHYETWYPISWLFAYLFEYNLATLQYEYLFNLLVAGLGFYKFSSIFKLNEQTRVIGAVSYMLCGVFISQASHLGYVTSGAWMPLVFYYLYKLLKEPNFKWGLNFLFFYILLVTGGYPGNFIAITYICIAYALYSIYIKYSNGKFTDLKKYATILPLLFIGFIAIYSLVLYSTIDLKLSISRDVLDYTNPDFGAMAGSTTFQSYLSLLSPSTLAVNNNFGSVSEMLNDVYIGIIPLLCSLFFLVYGRKHKYYKLAIRLFIFAIIFLLISVATQFPLHKLLYDYLPFINLFKFPSLFRIFFIFLLIIISLFGLDLLSISDKKIRKTFFYWVLTLGVIATSTLFFTDTLSIDFILNDFSKNARDINAREMLFLDSIILIFIVLVFSIAHLLKNKHLILLILILSSTDLILHTWIRNPLFVSTHKSPSKVDKQLKKIPDGFPLINQKTNMVNSKFLFDYQPSMWLNRFTYLKYPIIDGCSPYSLINYEKALMNKELENALNYPFIAIFDQFKNHKIDTAFYQKILTESIICTYTSPNEFHFRIKNSIDKFALFNHNSYKYWNFYENDKQLIPIMVSSNFFAVKLESNDSELKIIFEPTTTIKLFYLSAFSFITLIFLLLYINLKKKD